MGGSPPGEDPAPKAVWPAMIVAILAVSCASLFIRLAEAPSAAIAAYRVSLAALALAPVHLRRRRGAASPWTRRRRGIAFLAGSLLALHFLFWIQSLQWTTVASSVTLVCTHPVFVALLGSLWLREAPGRLLKIGIGLSVSGSALVAGADFTLSPRALAGDLLAVLGAMTAAGYLLAGRALRPHVDLWRYAFGVYATAAFLLVAACFLGGVPLAGFSPRTYLMLALLSLVPQLVGHTAFNWALKHLSAAAVAVLILGEPLGATLLAYLFLGETVSPVQGAGLALLATGIVLSARSP